jgi:hypothetical protein
MIATNIPLFQAIILLQRQQPLLSTEQAFHSSIIYQLTMAVKSVSQFVLKTAR